MNKIIINGEEFFFYEYRKRINYGEGIYKIDATDFYKESKIIEDSRKYLLFGPYITHEERITLFTIEGYVTDYTISAQTLKGRIELSFLNWQAKEIRKKEIERGEYI